MNRVNPFLSVACVLLDEQVGNSEIYPNLASCTYSWIVVKWEDTNSNGFVNTAANVDTYRRNCCWLVVAVAPRRSIEPLPRGEVALWID